MKKVILFDLDGTLLPMDQDVFVKTYFGALAKKLAGYGYDPEKLIESIWIGTKAMIKNVGEKTNEEVFWDKMEEIYGAGARADEPKFDEFYRQNFEDVRVSCGFNPKAAETIAFLKNAGFRIALATNPIFPAIATESRMRWAGLNKADFELYTTYENSRRCKPNPAYYEDILRELDVEGKDCLMVGNDVREDMVAATLGMDVFLLTDCLINRKDEDISQYPHGGFDDLMKFINERYI